jgi:uncharacterized repeat protein (TIGR01451 family)
MLVKKIATLLFLIGAIGLANAALAQTDAEPKKDPTIIDRIDNFGKSLFSGILPAKKAKPKETPKPKATPYPLPESKVMSRQPATIKPSFKSDIPQDKGMRAGSVLTGTEKKASSLLGAKSSDDDFMPENTPPAVSRSHQDESKPIEDVVPETPASTLVSQKSDTTEVSSDLPSEPSEPSTASQSVSQPLYERMAGFRHSVFSEADAAKPQPKQVAESKPEKAVEEPTEPESTPVKPSEPVRVAQRPKMTVDAEPPAAPQLSTPMSTPSKAISDSSEVVRESLAATKSETDDGMLIARKGPALSVETLGPRRITVGKESTYEVNMVNSGDVAAEDMVVFISLPEWAEVVGADTSTGAARDCVSSPSVGTLQWKLGRLDASGRARLMLKLIPRQSKPFDLAVRWEYRPISSQAMIEVQEPKLALQLEGPREVLYGKKETYRLKLMNVGNGAAENVALMLMPIGGGENVPATHKIGILAAGEEKVLDVELTARQAGNLTIQLDARADGGVHAELAEKVLVRRAELKVDVEGPKMQFVGATTSYVIHVRNPGSAPAKNVNVSIVLPAGSKYLAGLDGVQPDVTGSRLYWTIKTIAPQVDQMFMLKCSLGSAGVSRVEISAAADDELTASANTVTRVEAVADLTLDIVNPKGPVAVGDEAVYEVHVHNRGTKAAEGVEVFGYFSRGIEPVSAEGVANRMGPGQVVFQPIPVLTPGSETILKIRAKADDAGNHIFRAEAHCKTLGTRLISEAGNLFYTEASMAQGSTQPADERKSVSEAMLPTNRYQQGQLTPVMPRK